MRTENANTRTTGSMVLIAVATVLGLLFGYGAGLMFADNANDPNGTIKGILGAVIVGLIAAAGAWWVTSRPAATVAGEPDYGIQVSDPRMARFLFQDTRSAALWLPLRIYLGVEWLQAGLHKFENPAWMDTGAAIRGYWTRAITPPAEGANPPATYEWWRTFLQGLIDAEAHTWFAKVIVFGEILVGIGLIAGALVGIAAAAGILMNVSFMLSGSASTNPIMLLIGIGILLAWKVAGWIGLDRWLLPALGTPWHRGRLLARDETPAPSAPPVAS